MRDTPGAEPVLLSFQQDDAASERSGNLSAALQVGDDLWLGSDEGTTVDRLSPVGPSRYGRHVGFSLSGVLDLPGDADDEIDVEGLACADGWLWVTGSHSAKRSDPDPVGPDGDVGDHLRRLARTRRRGNRYLLARVPLSRAAEGLQLEPRRKVPGLGRAARLPGGRRRNLLTDALRRDEHLGSFLRIPGKDNGFNVEGLAVAGGRVFLGLRGPVLHGWAMVLVIAPEPDPEEPGALRLARLGGTKRVYHKMFLDLHGLGIRDLETDGADLLVLAGPTMRLDGDAVVLRWPDALAGEGDQLVPRDRFRRVVDLPYGEKEEEGVDHPEGIALLRDGEARSLLVVYDSPSPRRRPEPTGVVADRFPI